MPRPVGGESRIQTISLLIFFYCALIFLAVGNAKLRFPLMPFFLIYCAYFLSHLKDGMWRAAVFNKWNIILVLIFLCNTVYKYSELLLSPSEIHMQKIELCNQLCFPKTVLYLIEHPKTKFSYPAIERERLSRAERAVRKKLFETPDAP